MLFLVPEVFLVGVIGKAGRHVVVLDPVIDVWHQHRPRGDRDVRVLVGQVVTQLKNEIAPFRGIGSTIWASYSSRTFSGSQPL